MNTTTPPSPFAVIRDWAPLSLEQIEKMLLKMGPEDHAQMIKTKILPEEFVVKKLLIHFDYDNYWKLLLFHQRFSVMFLDIFFRRFNQEHIDLICQYQKLDDMFLDKHWEHVDFNIIFQYQQVSMEFIEKHSRWHWSIISEFQNLTDEFIEKHKQKIQWYRLSGNNHISKKTCMEYGDLVNWHMVFTRKDIGWTKTDLMLLMDREWADDDEKKLFIDKIRSVPI